MKNKLNPRLSSSDWRELCERFHFPAEKLQYIQTIYTALLPLVDSYVYYSLTQDMDEIAEAISLIIKGGEENVPAARAIVQKLTDKYPLL